jgi:hypothetical protein
MGLGLLFWISVTSLDWLMFGGFDLFMNRLFELRAL